jgi:hypothetical protein
MDEMNAEGTVTSLRYAFPWKCTSFSTQTRGPHNCQSLLLNYEVEIWKYAV